MIFVIHDVVATGAQDRIANQVTRNGHCRNGIIRADNHERQWRAGLS